MATGDEYSSAPRGILKVKLGKTLLAIKYTSRRQHNCSEKNKFRIIVQMAFYEYLKLLQKTTKTGWDIKIFACSSQLIPPTLLTTFCFHRWQEFLTLKMLHLSDLHPKEKITVPRGARAARLVGGSYKNPGESFLSKENDSKLWIPQSRSFRTWPANWHR